MNKKIFNICKQLRRKRVFRDPLYYTTSNYNRTVNAVDVDFGNNWLGSSNGAAMGYEANIGFTLYGGSGYATSILRRIYEKYFLPKLKELNITFEMNVTNTGAGYFGLSLFNSVASTASSGGAILSEGLYAYYYPNYNTLCINYGGGIKQSITPSIATGSWYKYRVLVTKNTIKVKYWLTSSAEPDGWDLNYAHTSNFGGFANESGHIGFILLGGTAAAQKCTIKNVDITRIGL